MMHYVKTTLAIVALMLGCIAPAEAQPSSRLYAYANPLPNILKFADHTWVTDYSTRPRCPNPAGDYWYSTGDCHPAGNDNDPRPLADATADLSMAKCIATPNESAFTPGPATARIRYAIDGVCHQIANRILAATGLSGSQAVTVERAHGYRISRFVYGEYGTRAQWNALRSECSVPSSVGLEPEDEVVSMTRRSSMQLSDTKLKVLRSEQTSLRAQIQEIGRLAVAGKIPSRDVANRVNIKVNDSLRRLVDALGSKDFEQFFDWPATLEIVLADPAVAAKIKYSSRQ